MTESMTSQEYEMYDSYVITSLSYDVTRNIRRPSLILIYEAPALTGKWLNTTTRMPTWYGECAILSWHSGFLRSDKCKAGKYTILAWHGVHKHRNIANNMVSLPLFTNTGTPSRRLEFCAVADTVIRALGRIRWLAHHKKRVITLYILSGFSLNLLPLMPQQSGDSCSTSLPLC